MAQVANLVTTKSVAMFQAESGLTYSVGAISQNEQVPLAAVPNTQIAAENAAFELIERSAGAKYPVFYFYCDRVVNDLKEKFRTFSGKAHMVIEIRVSQDRLDGLERQLQLYTDAATQVLDMHRGDWGDGVFFGGTDEIQFGTCKHGGKNFIKTAKILFPVDVSIN